MRDLLVLGGWCVFCLVGRPKWLFRWMGLLMVGYVLAVLAWHVFVDRSGFVVILVDLAILAWLLLTIEVDRQRAIRKQTVSAYRRFFYGEEPEE